MLTVEEFKRAVEFAEGFEFDGVKLRLRGKVSGSLSYVKGCAVFWFSSLDILDLFLDRVIQGINNTERISINTTKDFIQVLLFSPIGKNKSYVYGKTTGDIREAREKAIRFVLKEIKNVNK